MLDTEGHVLVQVRRGRKGSALHFGSLESKPLVAVSVGGKPRADAICAQSGLPPEHGFTFNLSGAKKTKAFNQAFLVAFSTPGLTTSLFGHSGKDPVSVETPN